MTIGADFPVQTLPFRSKGTKWRHACMDWATAHTYFNDISIRDDVVKMKTNYDLVNGVIHMEDVNAILNPNNLAASFVPDKILHYPILNAKLNTLRGEEAARVFDWKVIVTNPNAVSEIEKDKKEAFYASIQNIVEDTQTTDQQAEQQVQDNQDFYDYEWQDIRELRGNELLKHYSKEQDFQQMFNDGFMDALTVGREIYYCTIVGGEPKLMRLNPLKLRIFRNGRSNKIEDADLLIYEDYWSPGRIVDAFYDELSANDIKWLTDEIPDYHRDGITGPMGEYDERLQFRPVILGDDGIMLDRRSGLEQLYDEFAGQALGGFGSDLLPYDTAGNIRVVQMWWKSRRKVLKVKSFDPVTGEEVFDFYPETYVPDASKGEVATTVWVNEMWEGTKIGNKIYVGIRPCIVQHSSLSNPSRCHAGIIGTIYSINEMPPFSLVDMMKPYNYLYDAIHAKLVDLIATNWGKLLELDLAFKPKNWEVEKWMYFARTNKVLIKDSFNEGNKGAALGKTAASLNNATKGYIDADWGNSIQNYINLLEWAKNSMSELVGINRQREGNIYNRETVGGVERAVLQSSYITDWLFQQHDNTKKRVLEGFLEYAKASVRGRSLKFSYIMSDNSRKLMDIEGDEFCECDYGLVVDSSNDTQKLNQQIDTLAQAALQNQYKLSAIVKLYSSASLAEKTKILEKVEKEMQQGQQAQMQQQAQIEQQKIQADQQMKQMEMQQQDALNQRDNDTKVRVAEINSRAEELRLGIYAEDNSVQIRNRELDLEQQKLKEDIRQFDAELRQKDDELSQKKEIEMAKISASKAKANNSKR